MILQPLASLHALATNPVTVLLLLERNVEVVTLPPEIGSDPLVLVEAEAEVSIGVGGGEGGSDEVVRGVVDRSDEGEGEGRRVDGGRGEKGESERGRETGVVRSQGMVEDGEGSTLTDQSECVSD
jgi:hypothetical protein